MLRPHCALLAALSPACVGVSTLQGPDTLGKNAWRTGIEASLQGTMGEAGSTAFPIVDASYRYGLSDTVDVGGRFGPNGLGVFAKKLAGRSADGRLALAFMPQLSGGYLALGGKRSSYIHLDVPAIVGYRVADTVQLVAAPRLVPTLAMAHRPHTTVGSLVLSAGTTLGVFWKLGEHVELVPEVGVLVPLAQTAELSDAGGGNINTPGANALFQASVGVLFGR